MQRNLSVRAVLLSSLGSLCALLLSSCNTFETYADQSYTAHNAALWGDFSQAALQFSEEAESIKGHSEALLWQLEAAKAWQAAGDWPKSKTWFEHVEHGHRQLEDEAVIRIRDVAATGASLLWNAKLLAFKGHVSDRIQANCYQAINYLLLGNIEGAAVESRRAMYRQSEYETHFPQAPKAPNGDGIFDKNAERLATHYAEMDTQIKHSSDASVNGLSYFLRAIIAHIRGDFEQARHACAQYLSLGSSAVAIKSYRDALEKAASGARLPSYNFILFEMGLGPELEERRLELLLPKLGFTAFALPYPSYSKSPYTAPTLELSDGTSLELSEILNMDTLWTAEFKHRQMYRIPQLVASYLAKESLSRAVVNKADNARDKHLAYTATGLYKHLSQRADLRTWRLKGKQFYVACMPREASDAWRLSLKHTSTGERIQYDLPQSPKAGHQFIYIQGLTAEAVSIHSHVFDMH